MRIQTLKMTNILYIHQSSELYGSDKTLLYLVTELDKTRYNPIVVLPGEGPLKDALDAKGIRVILTPVIKLHRKMFTVSYLGSLPLQIKKSIAQIKKQTAGLKIDIVQSNTLAVLLGVFVSRSFKAKHIWHVHEIIVHPKFISNLYPKILNRYADKVVCNSNATLENLLHRNHLLKDKLRLIHNGLDASKFGQTANSNLRETLGYNPEDILITLIGRISRLKGHLLLLKVFNDHFSGRHVKMLFTGSPVPGQEYYLTDLEQKIAEYGLSEAVKIIPFQNDLSPIWGITDIAVSPSTEAESFGLVALEAMFSRKPVVATDLGGLKEIVIDGETGFLFENKNEAALKEALEKLISDKSLRESFGEKGHARAIENFSLEKYMSKFENCYAEVKNQVH
jgi:glycosyltransferase involved in cell wall biosynthesis